MEYRYARWVTSFYRSIPTIQKTEVSSQQSILTVLSGSSGTGGHSSMVLEYFNPDPEMDHEAHAVLIDLTYDKSAKKISINWDEAQTFNEHDARLTSYVTQEWWSAMQNRRHHCYQLTVEQTIKLINSVAKFQRKAREGRYVYRYSGGALGVIFSLPGNRGINCADFLIKVLREAGIADFGYRLYDTPYRISK